MNRYLEKFREVQRGMSLRNVLTIEWVAAVQDMLRALAQGENIRLEGGLTRGYGAAGVSIGTRRARRGWGGGGAAAVSVIQPFTIVAARPAYIPEPPAAVASGFARFYVTWGMANGILPENWSDAVDIPVTAAGIRSIVLKAFVSPLPGSLLRVTTCEWDAYTEAQVSAGAVVSPDYAEDGSRPAHLFIPLGQIIVTAAPDGSPEGTPLVVTPLSTGGSIQLQEYVADIRFADQVVKYRQGISIQRVSY